MPEFVFTDIQKDSIRKPESISYECSIRGPDNEANVFVEEKEMANLLLYFKKRKPRDLINEKFKSFHVSIPKAFDEFMNKIDMRFKLKIIE
ncbi:MAG: hypothetical protein Q8O83_01605 [bacterium]|nr:hypothetical protein [bacterium]